jgi:hypothetical protein
MQYIFLNSAPGNRWNQNKPESVTDAIFREPMDAIATPGDKNLRLGLSFILSYLDGAPETLEETLRRLLALSEKHDTPLLMVLDAQNWWGYRADLWNWWAPTKPGYNPANVENVEWIGWGPEHAVKIGWRNWGRQIRVLPPPNLAAPRYREAIRSHLPRFAGQIKKWADRLPKDKRYLFPGVKVGWEASIGINAYHYPNGNSLLDQAPAQDPATGLDMKKDFAGGLPPQGYAALTSKGWKREGTVTRADHERIVQDYLAYLSHLCRDAGLKRDQVYTHAGGQYAPWEKHYTHGTAINPDALPGWSLYGTLPQNAGNLPRVLEKARLQAWCAAEWLPHSRTPEEWTAAYRQTLAFRKCRHISVYNWEGIRNQEAAIAGLRQALQSRPT